MSAISTLVSLNLIARVSLDLLEQPKYKCLVPLATVKSLAKESSIDFEQFYYNYWQGCRCNVYLTILIHFYYFELSIMKFDSKFTTYFKGQFKVYLQKSTKGG